MTCVIDVPWFRRYYLVTYNKFIWDYIVGKKVLLNANIIINIIINYIVFLIHIFFLLKLILPMDGSVVRYTLDKSIVRTSRGQAIPEKFMEISQNVH